MANVLQFKKNVNKYNIFLKMLYSLTDLRILNISLNKLLKDKLLFNLFFINKDINYLMKNHLIIILKNNNISYFNKDLSYFTSTIKYCLTDEQKYKLSIKYLNTLNEDNYDNPLILLKYECKCKNCKNRIDNNEFEYRNEFFLLPSRSCLSKYNKYNKLDKRKILNHKNKYKFRLKPPIFIY